MILGALVIGVVIYGGLSVYEKNKIKEIQSAGPEDTVVPPSKAVLFCVNNKLALSVGIVAILLGLASYGPSRAGSSRPSPTEEPVAEL